MVTKGDDLGRSSWAIVEVVGLLLEAIDSG